MKSISTTPFWKFDSNYWIKELISSENGLSQKAAEELLLKTGVTRKRTSNFQKDVILFFSQYKSPLMLLLIGAVILSAFLGDTSDVFIILFIVLSTGILSFFQERNASKVVEKLQSMIALVESFSVRKEVGVKDKQTESSKRSNCLLGRNKYCKWNHKSIVVFTGDNTSKEVVYFNGI